MEHLNTALRAFFDPVVAFCVSTPLVPALSVAAAAIAALFVARRVLAGMAARIAEKTRFSLDEDLAKAGFFGQLAWLAPAAVVKGGLGLAGDWGDIPGTAVTVYMVVVGCLVLHRGLDGLAAYYRRFPMSRRKPVDGYVQLAKLLTALVALVASAAVVTGTSPLALLSGLGALTAVLMLVFKDTLLSVVASMNVAAYDLVRPGDWIEMPSDRVDGDVMEIGLHTVKVRNFDMTISSVPMKRFSEEVFRNWRGMEEAGGRRIKQSIMIDQSSVRFVDETMGKRLEKVELLAPVIEARKKSIAADNDGSDLSSPVNGRHLTNLGLFRYYVVEYLKSLQTVRQDMTLLVRQLPPSADKGLPLEIYCFTRDTAWVLHEDAKSDIFDHLLAAMPWFGLKVYQRNALADSR